jgi:hypothetical protein
MSFDKIDVLNRLRNLGIATLISIVYIVLYFPCFERIEVSL